MPPEGTKEQQADTEKHNPFLTLPAFVWVDALQVHSRHWVINFKIG